MTLLYFTGKMMICSGLLLAYYYCFLRNKKYNQFNRYYLLAAVLLSLIVPFVKIPVFYSVAEIQPAIYKTLQVITVADGEQDGMMQAQREVHSFLSVEMAGYILYALVGIALFSRLIKAMAYIFSISGRYSYKKLDDIRFYNTCEKDAPFSFFKSVYWNDNVDVQTKAGEQILRHEMFHVKERHSADIIFMEIICSLCWINPFFHLIKKELRAIHEFLADQYAIAENDPIDYMELIVVKAIENNRHTIGHQFFQSHLKRRIHMITQLSKTKNSLTSRVFTVPFLAATFIGVTMYAAPLPMHKKMVVPSKDPITVVIDAGHGGMDKGMTGGGLNEKDIALDISKKIRALAPQYNINVVMTREDDILPGHSNDVVAGLKKRVEISAAIKPDVFVAIHMDGSGDSSKNGYSIYVGADDRKSKHLDESKAFGNFMVGSIKNTVNPNSQLAQRSSMGIWVLEASVCPAVLIECGYLTNEKDRNYIVQPQNQEIVAKAVLEGIVQYHNQVTNTK